MPGRFGRPREAPAGDGKKGPRVHLALALTRSDAPGGVQTYVRDLAPALQARGCRVTVLAGGRGRLLDDLREAGVAVVPLRHMSRALHPLRDLAALLELRGALRRLAPDLVSLHSSKAGWLGRVAGWSLRLPTVFTAHGWTFQEGVPRPARDVYRLLELLAARLPARVATVCEADRLLARRRLRLETRAIPNGVPDGPHRADPGQDPPHLVMAARFSPQKDHGLLLRALDRLRDRPWHLHLPGEGPPPLRDPRVSLPGFLEDPAPLLARCQIAVLCSRWEGLPLSVLEAMRAGLPVVATDVGGVAEAVAHGETGLLVRDEDGLTSALARLLDDPALRRRLGEAGRRRYEAEFRHELMVDRTLEFYRC